MPGIIKSLVLLALTATTLFASVVPEPRQVAGLGSNNPGPNPNLSLKPRQLDTNPSTDTSRLTNAERFARGLPPSKPKRLYTPTRRTPAPSLAPQEVGIIQVKDSNGNSLGYVDLDVDNHTYGLTTDIAQAVQVAVTLQTNPPGNIVTINGFPQTYFGAVEGEDGEGNDLGVQSDNYALLTGVDSPTTPGSGPQSGDGNNYSDASGTTPPTAETAIWSVDPTSLAITAQYINTDLSKPTTIITYDHSGDFFALVGDFLWYTMYYGDAEIVYFTFIQTV